MERIEQLKKERDAVVLAHYYVNDDVQAIADYVGDSYYLSELATKVTQKTILFCGVAFMGESAKILNPEKTVIMPDAEADCPMAHMITVKQILAKREQYDDLAVVCYINSTAEIKTYADVCVTSSNALRIVKALPQKNIYFIPDENLGSYIAGFLPEKNFIFDKGFCPIHAAIKKEDVEKARAVYPDAIVLAHPECTMDVLDSADFTGSTSAMIDYATASEAEAFIVCTELGIFYELQRRNPAKRFYPAKDGQVCPGMKRVTLAKVADALENLSNPVELNEAMRQKAVKSLAKMLELAQQEEAICK
jgi:quinolinate synthase